MFTMWKQEDSMKEIIVIASFIGLMLGLAAGYGFFKFMEWLILQRKV